MTASTYYFNHHCELTSSSRIIPECGHKREVLEQLQSSETRSNLSPYLPHPENCAHIITIFLLTISVLTVYRLSSHILPHIFEHKLGGSSPDKPSDPALTERRPQRRNAAHAWLSL